MFIGPRINTVFASRWKALGWAAGMLFSAWCMVPDPQPDGSAGDDAGVDLAVKMLGGQPASDQPPPANPWGK